MPSMLLLLALAADLLPNPVSPLLARTIAIGFEPASEPFLLVHRQAAVAIATNRFRLRSLGVDVVFRNTAQGVAAVIGGPNLPGLVREYPGGDVHPHVQGVSYSPYPDFSFQFALSAPGEISWTVRCRAESCNWADMEFEIPQALNVGIQAGGLVASLETGRLAPFLRIHSPSRGRFVARGTRSFGVEGDVGQAFEVVLAEFPTVSTSSDFSVFTVPDTLDRERQFAASPYHGCYFGLGSPLPCNDVAAAKLNPDGELDWLTILHGNRNEMLDAFRTAPDGALYISGRTTSPTFPVTPAAIQSRYAHPADTPIPSSEGVQPTDYFLARLNRQSGELLAATFLGGPNNEDRAILEIAPDGSLFLLPRQFALPRAGTPTTPNSFAPTCAEPCERRWAARIASDLSRLIYATYLQPGSTAYQVHTDQSLYFVGYTFDPLRPGTAYAARLDPLGQRLLFDTRLNPNFASTHALAVTPRGETWVSVGEIESRRSFLYLLGADGATVRTQIPLRSSVLAADRDGNLHAIEGGEDGVQRCGLRYVVYSQTGNLIHSIPIPGAPAYRLEPSLPSPQLYLDDVPQILNPDYTPPVVLSCVASPTTFQHLFALSPGMFVTLFGERMGPAGTRVFLNGWEAPVLFSSPGQVNIVVPYELPTGQPVDVEVQSAGYPSRTLRVNRTEATNLQLFPVVLNQDGTLNSAQNPAARDSIVILWATGAGNTNPPAATGEVLPLAPRPLALPLEVSASGVSRLEVLYAGAAPGFVAGLTQINVRLQPGIVTPDGIARLTALVGGTPDSVLVYVQPQ